jgi:LacI family transcriptional regulator
MRISAVKACFTPKFIENFRQVGDHRMNPDARPTLATIARAAGVSVPTVSKALNGRSDVAPATRQRIERLLDQSGYVRGSRADRGAVAPVIDVVIDSLDNSWAASMLGGVEAACHDAGLGVVVSVARAEDRRRAKPRWLDQAVARSSQGVLLCLVDLLPGHQSTLRRVNIPYVVVDPLTLPTADIPSVGATNWAGGLSATEHLIALGHRRIAVIGGPSRLLYSRARTDGYRAAMARAGLGVPAGYVRYCRSDTHDGRQATRDLLELDPRPTAIFAGSDPIALGAYRALREAGVTVPAEISVVGFDDRPESRWTSPRLTTVHQPLDEMGATAVGLLAAAMRGQMPRTRRVELATSLIERESTGPPPSP